MNGTKPSIRSSLSLLLLLSAGFVAPAFAATIILVGGERETVTGLRKDKSGGWLAVREGRLTTLKPQEVVAVVDDAGEETELLPPLRKGEDPPEVAAALERLAKTGNAEWETDSAVVAAGLGSASLDALGKLAESRSTEMRRRGITTLVLSRTKAGMAAALKAIVAEKDRELRRDAAYLLMPFREIVRRSGSAEAVAAGLADADATVRVTFAYIAPAESEVALKILRTDGLKHGDHHFRESSAMELAERGDGAGESLLVAMLARNSIPGLDTDAATAERVLVREHVQLCRLLGGLGTDRAKAALRTATRSRHEAVRKAAEAALKAG